jgi:hypothetical protein
MNGNYNCIAWTLQDDTHVWWPSPYGYYWPNDDADESVECFIKMYESFGFEVCDKPDFENGFIKIALYTDRSGRPKHGARMLDEINWTSKLGPEYDISHTLEGLSGDWYGRPTVFLRKKIVSETGD